MKKIYLAALSLLAFSTAFAQTEVLKISLNDGTVKTIPVDDIKELSFAVEEPAAPSPAEEIAGTYTGINTVVVGGQFTYTADISCTLTANADGTVNLIMPQYSLAETVMGDLTLGTITIADIPYDEEKGGFFKDYSSEGLEQHFTAVQNGTTSMDKDYVLGEGSTVLIEKTADGIKITNPFKLGAMPFPLVSTFEGSR